MIEPVIQNLSISDDITLRQQESILRKVVFIDGVMTTNSSTERSGLIARAFLNWKWGSSSSSTISEKKAKELLSDSKNNAKMISSFSPYKNSITHLPISAGNITSTSFQQNNYHDIEQIKIIDYARIIDQHIIDTCKKICTRRIMIYVDGIQKYIRTPFTNRLLCSTIKRSCLTIEIGAYDFDGQMVTVSKQIGVPYELGEWYELVKDAKLLTEQIYKALLDKTHATEIKKGVFPCILHPNVAGILAHEAIGHNVEADNVDNGSFVSAYGFASGAIVTVIASFEVHRHGHPPIEIYGSEGSLAVPNPNTFGGPVKLFRPGNEEWKEIPLSHIYDCNSRSVGLADMVTSLREGRPFRASGELAYHVLEVMLGFCESSRLGRRVEIKSRCERPAPLPLGLKDGEI